MLIHSLNIKVLFSSNCISLHKWSFNTRRTVLNQRKLQYCDPTPKYQCNIESWTNCRCVVIIKEIINVFIIINDLVKENVIVIKNYFIMTSLTSSAPIWYAVMSGCNFSTWSIISLINTIEPKNNTKLFLSTIFSTANETGLHRSSHMLNAQLVNISEKQEIRIL